MAVYQHKRWYEKTDAVKSPVAELVSHGDILQIDTKSFPEVDKPYCPAFDTLDIVTEGGIVHKFFLPHTAGELILQALAKNVEDGGKILHEDADGIPLGGKDD